MGEEEVASLELQLNDLVEPAFGLTHAQRELMMTTLPPRDPIAELQRSVQEALTPAAK